MTRLTTLLLFLIVTLSAYSQELTVKSFSADPMDLSAAKSPVTDLNGKACGLVKVRLAVRDASFEGSIIEPVGYKNSEYWVYMTEGSYRLTVKTPDFLPLDINFRDYGVQRVMSKQTYVLTIAKPAVGGQPADDGMRYLVIKVSPANAMVTVDGQLQTVQGGTASVLLPRGSHSYRVEAPGYSAQAGTVELTDGKKSVEVALESSLAQVTVTCPTVGSQIYVNEALKGASPWTGQLATGNYQVEARLDGYRPQRQSVSLSEREKRTVTLPALTAITGAVNVNYQPADAEVWIDGKRAGTSPDIFRNIPVGSHSVEVRASGYETARQTVTVAEGQTAKVSGQLASAASASTSTSSASTSTSSASTSTSSASTSTSSAAQSSASSASSKLPVPEAVDLGLSVKWASFNLGASKPEETGYYYKWGETEPTDTRGWWTYKHGKGTDSGLTKYCNDSKYGYNGFTDGKTVLEAEDDAAAVNLGGGWRMPTWSEIQELRSKCKREWTTIGDVKGISVTGPNGNTVFFPCSGYRYHSDGSLYDVGSLGYYWSASASSSSNGGRYLFFDSGGWYWGNSNRANGYPIRPVLGK